jgi:hypothetical protein
MKTKVKFVFVLLFAYNLADFSSSSVSDAQDKTSNMLDEFSGSVDLYSALKSRHLT